jgi:transposase-like protein
LKAAFYHVDRLQDRFDYGFVSDTSQLATSGSAKRILRTAEEKRRIVEATLLPGASIARVARENGVNANQVFQWRYEYRHGAGWAKQPQPELLAVTIASEPKSVTVAEVASGVHSLHLLDRSKLNFRVELW